MILSIVTSFENDRSAIMLREHLTRIRMAPNITVTYLSPKIQNELIELLARHVKQKIVNNIKEAKYYSMLFDYTPDISHTDQMTQIIRYVVSVWWRKVHDISFGIEHPRDLIYSYHCLLSFKP